MLRSRLNLEIASCTASVSVEDAHKYLVSWFLPFYEVVNLETDIRNYKGGYNFWPDNMLAFTLYSVCEQVYRDHAGVDQQNTGRSLELAASYLLVAAARDARERFFVNLHMSRGHRDLVHVILEDIREEQKR